MDSLIQRFLQKGVSKLVLAVIAVLTIVQLFSLSYLKPVYDFNEFFPKSDSAYAFFEGHVERFGQDNSYVLVAIENKKGIFDYSFLEKIKALSLDIGKVDSVERVFSPLDLKDVVIQKDPIFRSEIPFEIAFFHLEDKTRLAQDSAYIFSHKEVIGTLIAEDAKSLLMLVHISDKVTGSESEILTNKLIETVDKYEFDDTHIAGKIIAETSYISRMMSELVVFVVLGFLLLVFFLWIAFRSTWGVVLPLTVIQLAVIWTMGMMVMLGNDLDIMSLMIPTIIFVVGMSDVIHITSKYLDELRQGVEKREALARTMKEVGLATLLTSITTALGFVTLMFTAIKPMQNFGVHTAIGVMLSYFLAFTFYPAILYLLPAPKGVNVKDESFWKKHLSRFFIWIMHHKLLIVGVYVGLMIFSAWGISRIDRNAFLIDEVADTDQLKVDFEYMSEHYSGGRPFELSLKTEEESIYNVEIVRQIEAIEKYLGEEFLLKNPTSILTVIKSLNRGYHGGDNEFYEVPPSDRELKKLIRKSKTIARKDKRMILASKDKQYARVSGNIPDVGSVVFLEKKNAFNEFMKRYPDLQADLTGSPNLIDLSNHYLSMNMIQGLSIAFLAISIIMGFLFKSMRVVVISLIPNVIPLLLIGGVMGAFDIRLNMTTAIIFTIAFGIAVDDTIHFMSKFKLELSKGSSMPYAVKTTFMTTGKAIIVTSIILIAGFLTLVTSSFNGMKYTGLLISLTLIFAVISDLVLIPLLVFYLYPKKRG